MKLIETEDLLHTARVNGFAGESAAKVLLLLSRIKRINKFYSENIHKKGIEFIDSMIDQLEVNFEFIEEELNRIPKEGPFITISNHPFGGIDGLLLIKLLNTVRPDYKVVPNFLLRRIEPVREFIFPDNPFENRKDIRYNHTSLRELITHLENNHPLGIFPAGVVSRYHQNSNGISDRQWQYPVLRMLKRSGVPIVPIYFQGSNSRLFNILGRIHPRLQTVKLPTELLNKKRKIIRIRIGSPISVKEQNEFVDISRFGRYLRAKTYALSTSLEVKKFFTFGGRRLKKEEKVIDPIDVHAIEAEIAKILPDYLLFKSQHYNIICVPSVKIPNIMYEIGRLREITFREVGEGTNQSMDIDEYDLYYHQLFIWDDESKKIVGAYRVGKGKEIITQYGVKGFYIQSLFRLNRRFYPVLARSLELGRSFIISEYQKKPMPLFLLWRGILYFLIKHPEYRYLIGPVSISNRFSNFSKAMIIKFIMAYYYNDTFARYIKPRKKFRVPLQNIDTEILFENTNDINRLDKFIKDIETTHYNMPVLLKKYLKQNGKIIGFNIDPKFNNALDGLMILDMFDVPPETIAALSKEVNDETILERFAFGNIYNVDLTDKF